MPKDLTEKQFEAKLKQYGIEPLNDSLENYIVLRDGKKSSRVSVSALNAGWNATRRRKLAYLINQQAKVKAEDEAA